MLRPKPNVPHRTVFGLSKSKLRRRTGRVSLLIHQRGPILPPSGLTRKLTGPPGSVMFLSTDDNGLGTAIGASVELFANLRGLPVDGIRIICGTANAHLAGAALEAFARARNPLKTRHTECVKPRVTAAQRGIAAAGIGVRSRLVCRWVEDSRRWKHGVQKEGDDYEP